MQDLDATDRKLLAQLKLDGRASITTLAARLQVSRATVKARLDRLVENGTISRFTVELDTLNTDEMIHAVMMIAVKGPLARTVVSRLRRIPEIVSLYSTNGAWDLVAQVETATLADFDAVLRRVREIEGVLNSETCLLLNRAI